MSGRIIKIRPYKMLNAVNISTDQTSAWTNIENVDVQSITLDWAVGGGANPVGAVTVEVQNGTSTAQTFTYGHKSGTLPTTALSVAVSGASGSNYIVLDSCYFEKMRIKYTSTSGTGTLTATLVAKKVGA